MKNLLAAILVVFFLAAVFDIADTAACEAPAVYFDGYSSETGDNYIVNFHGSTATDRMMRTKVLVNGQKIGQIIPQYTVKNSVGGPANLKVSAVGSFWGETELTEKGIYNIELRVLSACNNSVWKYTHTVDINDYVFTYSYSYWMADHVISTKFYVIGLFGSEVPVCSGTCVPTYVAMKVNGMIKSAMISTIDEPKPYLLFDFLDTEYEQLAGKTLEVIFYLHEKPYSAMVHFDYPD